MNIVDSSATLETDTVFWSGCHWQLLGVFRGVGELPGGRWLWAALFPVMAVSINRGAFFVGLRYLQRSTLLLAVCLRAPWFLETAIDGSPLQAGSLEGGSFEAPPRKLQ